MDVTSGQVLFKGGNKNVIIVGLWSESDESETVASFWMTSSMRGHVSSGCFTSQVLNFQEVISLKGK